MEKVAFQNVEDQDGPVGGDIRPFSVVENGGVGFRLKASTGHVDCGLRCEVRTTMRPDFSVALTS